MKPDPTPTNPDPRDATPPEREAESLPRALGLDEALLDEALAEPTPAALESRIRALTDPPTLSLLDEALAPEADQAFDERLNRRILAATMPGRAARASEDAPTVLARIASGGGRFAAAAAVVLAAGVGLWLLTQPDPAPRPQAASNNAASPDAIDAESIEIPDSPALFADATSRIESDLREVAEHLEDARINRETIWSDMEAYDAFLDDLESDLSGLST